MTTQEIEEVTKECEDKIDRNQKENDKVNSVNDEMKKINCAEKAVIQKTSCEEHFFHAGLNLLADEEHRESAKDILIKDHEKIID